MPSAAAGVYWAMADVQLPVEPVNVYEAGSDATVRVKQATRGTVLPLPLTSVHPDGVLIVGLPDPTYSHTNASRVFPATGDPGTLQTTEPVADPVVPAVAIETKVTAITALGGDGQGDGQAAGGDGKFWPTRMAPAVIDPEAMNVPPELADHNDTCEYVSEVDTEVQLIAPLFVVEPPDGAAKAPAATRVVPGDVGRAGRAGGADVELGVGGREPGERRPVE